MTVGQDDRGSGQAERPKESFRLELWLSVLLVLALALTMVSLHRLGKASRKMPDAVALRTTVESSRELLDALSSHGAQGAALISFSRLLHFVPTEGVLPDGPSSFPVPTFDLPEAFAQHVDYRSSLWTALELGIAREVLHILPAAEYRKRRASLGDGGQGTRLLLDRIETHERGSRRHLLDHLPEILPEGPLVVLVNASFLSGASVLELESLLSDPRLARTPHIYDLADDNPDVDKEARESLRNYLLKSSP